MHETVYVFTLYVHQKCSIFLHTLEVHSHTWNNNLLLSALCPFIRPFGCLSNTQFLGNEKMYRFCFFHLKTSSVSRRIYWKRDIQSTLKKMQAVSTRYIDISFCIYIVKPNLLSCSVLGTWIICIWSVSNSSFGLSEEFSNTHQISWRIYLWIFFF